MRAVAVRVGHGDGHFVVKVGFGLGGKNDVYRGIIDADPIYYLLCVGVFFQEFIELFLRGGHVFAQVGMEYGRADQARQRDEQQHDGEQPEYYGQPTAEGLCGKFFLHNISPLKKCLPPPAAARRAAGFLLSASRRFRRRFLIFGQYPRRKVSLRCPFCRRPWLRTVGPCGRYPHPRAKRPVRKALRACLYRQGMR